MAAKTWDELYGEGAQASTTSISDADLAKLESMDRDSLINLIRSVSGAVWGIGLHTKHEREEALLLKLITLALTRDDAKEVVALAKEYFDRSRGKPAQTQMVDVQMKATIDNQHILGLESSKFVHMVENWITEQKQITVIEN